MATEGKVSTGRFYDASSASEPPVVVSNPKLEVQAKMAKKMQDEEANYSYKPTLYTKPRKEHDKIDDNRYDRLYSDALKRHLESKWKESIEDKELTFKPKISAKGATSRSVSRDRGSVSESIEQRLLGLTPKAPQAEEFSFKPKITQRAKSIDRSQQREAPERLYQQGKTIQEKLEAKRQEQAQKAAEECTFAPKTNSRPSLTSHKSDLTERMSQYLAYKNQRLEEATKAKLDLEKENATFNPTIKLTKRSATPTKNVFDRLSVGGGSDSRSTSSEVDTQQFTFKPQLVTKRAPSPGPRNEYSNIHERLFKEGVKRQADLELERKLIQEENEGHLTFTPAINRKSSFTNKSVDLSTSSSQQPQGPVFERLSSTNNRLYMQEVLSKIKTDLELKDCTFKPKLVSENKAIHRESSDEPIYVRLEKEGERVKAEQARQKEQREAEAMKDVTFAPQINTKSSSFAKRRVSSADIHERLYAEKPVVPEPTVVEPPKKVLPKEDVEKIFRRLSITNTVSTEVAHTIRATGELPESPEHKHIQRKKSIILPEKDIDSLFNRLHTTSYDHTEEAEPAVKPVVKQATPRQVNEIVDRLSKHPAEAYLDNQSPRRSSRIMMGLGSPSNDSYEVTSLSSSVVGTPRGEGRKDSFRSPSPHATPSNAAAVTIHPGDLPPTPTSRVQPTNKFPANGNSSGTSSSNKANGIAVAAAAAAPSSPAAEGVAALPKPPTSHIPAPSTPKTSAAAAVFPPAPPTAPAAASSPKPAAAPAPAPVAATTTSTKSSTGSSKGAAAAAAAGSGAGSGGSAAANPDFFSKLEASLAFLETQLDTKSSAKSSPVPKTGSAAAPSTAASNEPAPSYSSVVKSEVPSH